MLVVNVRKTWGNFDIDAKFESGDGIAALFGKSGAGKSTLINMIAGLVTPDSGYISIGDQVVFDSKNGINLPPEIRAVGYIFQDSRLFPHFSVKGNLEYGIRARHGGDQIATFCDVVKILELSDLLTRKIKTLSGGERQRVAIGRALLSAPEMLLMDEPLASLDMQLRKEILPFIERLTHDLDVPAIYVTHNIGEIVRLADEIILINEGCVTTFGLVEEITARLDLAPFFDSNNAGSIMKANVISHDYNNLLTELDIGGNNIWIPLIDSKLNTEVRLRIRAKDVSVATIPPHATSVLNVIPGKIMEIGERYGSQINLKLDIGASLWSTITYKSLVDLDINQGDKVFALIKSVAVDRQSIGGRL